MNESESQFMQRKREHIQHALNSENQTLGLSGLDQIELIHDSLPTFNLDQVSIESEFLGNKISTPFFIPGMTAGHPDAEAINFRLASLAAKRGWLLGLGSQRRELDLNFKDVSSNLLTQFPTLKLISNLGITQLIELHQTSKLEQFYSVIENTRSKLVAIHLNPLQEAIQTEGTPNFSGAFDALKILVRDCPVPVVLKETGSGMSVKTIQKIRDLPFFAVDVSGLGGTHWGRIEGARAENQSMASHLGRTFENWGVGTVQSVKNAVNGLDTQKTEIWASGGVRTGLDAAKLIALGAKRVGLARPALEAAILGEEALDRWMQCCEQELRVALFCTGSQSILELNVSCFEEKCNET